MNLVDNKKAHRLSYLPMCFYNICEISMKQNTIPSQTTARLYQHPTVEEQRPSRLAAFKANAIDFLKFIALSVFLWVVISSAITWVFGG